MDRFDQLDELRAHIFDYLEAAVRDRDNAMTTPVFATDGPGVRTVALRQFNLEERALLFHTDLRSKKVEQIEDNPRAIWLAWDKSLSQQFRLAGHTTVHADDEVADALWESEPDEDLEFYYKTSPPGARAEKPTSGINTKAMSEEVARTNFAAVRTVVDEIVWLHIPPTGEYQARFEWDGEEFEGHWVVP